MLRRYLSVFLSLDSYLCIDKYLISHTYICMLINEKMNYSRWPLRLHLLVWMFFHDINGSYHLQTLFNWIRFCSFELCYDMLYWFIACYHELYAITRITKLLLRCQVLLILNTFMNSSLNLNAVSRESLGSLSGVSQQSLVSLFGSAVFSSLSAVSQQSLNSLLALSLTFTSLALSFLMHFIILRSDHTTSSNQWSTKSFVLLFFK